MKLILYFAFVTAALSYTLTETKIFASFRQWIRKRNSFLGDLFSCGYCISYWIAFGLVAVYKPNVFNMWWLLDYFLTAIIIAWLAAFQWLVMCWLMEKAGK